MGEVGESPTLSRNCNCSQRIAIEVRLPAETARRIFLVDKELM